MPRFKIPKLFLALLFLAFFLNSPGSAAKQPSDPEISIIKQDLPGISVGATSTGLVGFAEAGRMF